MSTQNTEAPSPLAAAIGSALIAGILGYFLGQGSSLGLFGNSSSQSATLATKLDAKEPLSESDESDEDDSQEGLNDFGDKNEECKLVLVVRTDLGMTKGKIAAQASHATLACYKTLLNSQSESSILKRWERLGQAKVAVQVKSEEELETLQAQAMSLGLCAKIIHDAGRTQIAAGSATVLGVGPGPKSVVNQVTGHLKLL